MRRVIVNSTPLIILSRIGKLELLRQLYSSVEIPKAVYDEVFAKNDSSSEMIAGSLDWIKVSEITAADDRAMYRARLHAGEVEVMILAQEEPKADLLIIDDNAAKKTAKYLGLKVTGTLGVLLQAKKKGCILEISPLLKKLKECGFYVNDTVIDMVLKNAGEK